MAASDVYYFGCWEESGHYLWRAEGRSARREESKVLPWSQLDGTLPPADRRPMRREGDYPEVDREAPQGHAALHHKGGWTAIAFWDRSVDRRPGSSSTFLIRGIHTWEDAVRIAKAVYPRTWARYGFPIVLAQTPSGMQSAELMSLEEKAAACDRFSKHVMELEDRVARLEAELEVTRTASCPPAGASGTRPSSS